MDIIDQISKYLTDNVTMDASITSPLLSSDPSSVAIRETPSSIANRYMNTNKTFNFQFQILVKDPSTISARKIINDIFSKLDGISQGAIVSGNNSFTMSTCECTVTPNWVETNESNEHIYTAIFNAELELGG